MGSGSEMLRQIGMSLRERSQGQEQVRSSRADTSESRSLGIKQRSRSASRFNQPPGMSSSLDPVKPHGKPPISKKPDLKLLQTRKVGSENKMTGTAMSLSSAVNSNLNTSKSSESDDAAPRPALPPRSTKTLPATKSQSMSSGFHGPPPPLPAKPKFSSSSSNSDTDQKGSNGVPKKKDQIQTIFTPSPLQLQRVVLEKKSFTDDFGFSLSDALEGRGVYVSSVRSGSLAEKIGLKAYDRVLQVCVY